MSVAADLEQLSAGTLGWVVENLDYFDPFGADARTPGLGRAKAALELALLCHCWSRQDGHDARLDKANALLRTVWRHPGFPGLLTAEPEAAAVYRLVAAALAPHGVDPWTGGAPPTPEDLTPEGLLPYRRLELRFYADKAGVHHTIEPYEDLVGKNVLVTLPAAPAGRPPEPPVTIPRAYALTHSASYLSDFGRTAPGLTPDALTAAADLLDRQLEHCVRHSWWDLAAELVTARHCLGGRPLDTAVGAAAVRCLADAQLPGGALPGRTAADRDDVSGPLLFAKAYHTTLVTALMTVLVGVR
ncbi:DUF6895 family protein [Streptomyces sp. NPDC021020]|uniref:DUF6895 family protein n=1 Tax=Streptomyces sp. NPDC021020 TaxID=3365109 RepID=UPI00378815A3